MPTVTRSASKPDDRDLREGIVKGIYVGDGGRGAAEVVLLIDDPQNKTQTRQNVFLPPGAAIDLAQNQHIAVRQSADEQTMTVENFTARRTTAVDGHGIVSTARWDDTKQRTAEHDIIGHRSPGDVPIYSDEAFSVRGKVDGPAKFSGNSFTIGYTPDTPGAGREFLTFDNVVKDAKGQPAFDTRGEPQTHPLMRVAEALKGPVAPGTELDIQFNGAGNPASQDEKRGFAFRLATPDHHGDISSETNVVPGKTAPRLALQVAAVPKTSREIYEAMNFNRDVQAALTKKPLESALALDRVTDKIDALAQPPSSGPERQVLRMLAEDRNFKALEQSFTDRFGAEGAGAAREFAHLRNAMQTGNLPEILARSSAVMQEAMPLQHATPEHAGPAIQHSAGIGR